MLRSIGSWWLVLLPAISLVSACGATQTYAGEKRDRADVAVVKVPYYAKGLFVTVESIDGAAVEGEAFAKLAVLPGHHVLAGRARGFGHGSEGTAYSLDFIARAGATYDLDLSQGRFSDKMTVSVIHSASHEKIAQIEVWP